jgi:hypothetical protein
MRAGRRVALAACAAVVLAAWLGVSWYFLPGPKGCVGPGSFVPSGPFAQFHCDSGAVDIFGAGVFTLFQTLVMALGIGTAALLWSRAIMPSLRAGSLGLGIAALALVVAITLPSPVVGAAPSVPCSTPGPNGAVSGSCATGPAPTDRRTADRGLVLIAGAVAVALGVWRDSRSLEVVS